MEQQQTTATGEVTTRSAGVRYGLIGGVIGIAFFLILTTAGVDIMQSPLRWLGYLIALILIVLSHKYYKDNNAGFMSYGQGVTISFWYGLISSLINSIFTYIYVKFIDTGFMDMVRQKQEEEMAARGMSDEQIEQAMKFASMFSSPEAILIFGIVFGIIGLVILGLIVSIFTQKKAPDQAF